MDHFLYRDGILHAEDVPVPEIAAAVGTPFYVYSTATLLRHYRLFEEALAGLDHLVCYAVKAASNQAILRTLGAGRGGDGRGFGRRIPAGAGRRRAGRAYRLLRCRQDSRRDPHRAGGRHPPVQRRIRTRDAGAERGGAGAGQGRPDHDPRQPGCRRAHPCQDCHRQIREQVRHPHRARPRRLCAGRAPAGARGGRHRRAYRQPADQPGALRAGLSQGRRADRDLARRRA